MRTLWCAVLILSLAGMASAQTPFQTHGADAQIRASVVLGPESALVAAYDKGEVWKVNPATGEIVSKAAVGKGPVALALSPDKKTAACVNNLESTVAYLDVEAMTVRATVDGPKGATSIAALRDGRFAVASGFADAVWIVDPGAPGVKHEVEGVDGVPVAVAANGPVMVVALSVPPSVKVIADQKTITIPLSECPKSIAALGADGFVVGMPSRVAVIDAATGRVTAEAELRSRDVAADDGRVLVLCENDVVMLDASLKEVARVALAQPGFAIASGGGCILVASPVAKAWQTHGMPSLVVAEAKPVPPEPAPAEPVKTEPAPPEPAKPEPVSQEPPKTEPAAAAPVSAEPAPAEPHKSEPAPEAAPEEPKAVPRHGRTPVPTITRVSANRPKTYAEILGNRPMPGAGVSGVPSKSKTPSPTQGMTLNPTAGINPPDWTQPLRDIEADEWEGGFGQDELSLQGNVHLRLDTMTFDADQFYYNKPTGEMHASGDVLVTQQGSYVKADDIYYKVPEVSELPPTCVLVPHRTEQQRAKLRLSSGLIKAKNADIEEPERMLTARSLEYDIANGTGDLEDARGLSGIYYFGATKLRLLGPASADAEDLWVTTCDHDPPHYKVRIRKAMIREGKAVYGEGAQLYLGSHATPLYWPWWGYQPGQAGMPIGFDFESGHRARIGYFANAGIQFDVTPEAKLGLRVFPTSKAGVGFGADAEYDYMKNPSLPLFLSRGTMNGLYTTEGRGYLHLYHRHELWENTVALVQVEAWTDPDFYKDFFWDAYKNRTAPRSFVNVTHTEPTYIVSGTVRADVNGFVNDTDALPELSFHLLERRIAPHLYFSYDTINGYYQRAAWNERAARLENVARLTYDVNVSQALSITPFVELEGTFYSEDRLDNQAEARLAGTAGVTLQTRLHREYPGIFGFSGLKHVVVPSVTYSYRPAASMDYADTPIYDAYDAATGRSRIETKLDNVLYGRDAETNQVWRVARLSLYEGNDFWNEFHNGEDYEAELDIRPRPWWGWLMAAEHHNVSEGLVGDGILARRDALGSGTREATSLFVGDGVYDYVDQYGQYSRLLSYFYYGDTSLTGKVSGRLGFAYTETLNTVYNREILYGLGYRLGENWGLAFEHRYDIERDELTQQKYQIRRTLHCWEAALTFRDRQSGWDFGIEFSITAFPGTRVKF